MKGNQKLWSRDELILVINLYYKLPFGQMHSRAPGVIKLAGLINRTPGAVAYKLVNFGSFDPSLKARGIKGAANASKLDKAIWEEFYNNIGLLIYESEELLAEKEQVNLKEDNRFLEEELLLEGRNRESLVKVRLNQDFFRKSILAAYNNTCCITGLQNPALLISSHIVPWSLDEKNRLNPRNGIAINALHDRAFENGLITITPEYKIRVSPLLKERNSNEVFAEYFGRYDGQEIILPTKFLPDKEFLTIHNQRFRSSI